MFCLGLGKSGGFEAPAGEQPQKRPKLQPMLLKWFKVQRRVVGVFGVKEHGPYIGFLGV